MQRGAYNGFLGITHRRLSGSTWYNGQFYAQNIWVPNDLARSFADTLGHPVRVEIVPRASWAALFRSRGAKNPLPRMRMLDGFNEGWIEFRGGGGAAQKGSTALSEVIGALVAEAGKK